MIRNIVSLTVAGLLIFAAVYLVVFAVSGFMGIIIVLVLVFFCGFAFEFIADNANYDWKDNDDA